MNASSAASDNPIVATIPFDEDGKHHGFLRLPYSRDDSAWGSVMIPITVVRNGDGPTALLTGANHGDEYEGPVALQALTRDLDPKDVHGRVVIVPFMNAPAFRAGKRTSPLDGGEPEPHVPGPPGRHADAEDRGLFQPHARADGRLRPGLPLRRQDLGFHTLRRGAQSRGGGAGGGLHRRDAGVQRALFDGAAWKSTTSACSIRRWRRSERSSSPPNLAEAAPRRRDRSESRARACGIS